MSTLESRVASLSLGGHVGWQCLIGLALSESSACSSPTSETSGLVYTPDDNANDVADLVDGVEKDMPLPLPLPASVKQMVSALPITGDYPLLEHLLCYPVTLADVEALVPALINSPEIMGQLVVNIGHFSACRLIPSPDLERMLIHLLAVGDDQNYLYETTKTRIELERQRHQHLEHVLRQKRVENPGKTEIMVNSAHHCETIGDFSRSRLHNGPGLTDRKHPKVRLPQNDTRQVSAMPNLLVPEMNTRVEHDHLWTKSKASSDFLSGKEQKGEVVVKFPLKNLRLRLSIMPVLLQPRRWRCHPHIFAKEYE